jgi:hypothetical protein
VLACRNDNDDRLEIQAYYWRQGTNICLYTTLDGEQITKMVSCCIIILYYITHGAEPFLRSCHLCSHSSTSQGFMEPEGSLPCSQEPFTGPYPQPDKSNPHHPILSKIHFNIVHPPTSWFSHQYHTSICIPLLPHSCYMPCPSHPPWLDLHTWRKVQVVKLLIMQFSLTSRRFMSLRSKYSHQHPVLKHPQPMFLP